MSLQGPILVVGEETRPPVVGWIESAGAFPVIEAGPDEAEAAIATVGPTAIILTGTTMMDAARASAVADRAARQDGPIIPVFTLVTGEFAPARIAIMPMEPDRRAVTARLRAALRVRTLQTSVLRRLQSQAARAEAPAFESFADPLEDTTVLVAGRGRAYPALTTAVGELVGLIGALSLETAASYLEARDIDGLVIGDGFNRGSVADFVDRLSRDPRFRDLPITVVEPLQTDVDPERLPFLHLSNRDPVQTVTRLLPLARMHALSSRLRRLSAAIDAKGVLDADTGLYTREAFANDLAHAVCDSAQRGHAFAIARFSLDNLSDTRTSKDAARLVSRLVRSGDFATRDRDGTILVAFSDTDLGTAHVVARRIASVLKHTMLAPGCERTGLRPTIALAALKSKDTPALLLSRVSADRLVAAE